MAFMTAFEAQRRMMDVKRHKAILPRVTKDVVCEMFNITDEDLLGDNKYRDSVEARQFYCKLLRDYGASRSNQLTYREIGETFWKKQGGHSASPRDHASVLHNVKMLGFRLTQTNHIELREAYDACIEEVERRVKVYS